MDLGDLRSMEVERAWKEIMAGSRRDAEVTKEMSPRHEAVRGIDPWWHEVSLPDVDPVFQSSCCGNSYCKKWFKITMASVSRKLHTSKAKVSSSILNGAEWTESIQYAPTHRVQVVGMSLILRRNSCMRDKAAHRSVAPNRILEQVTYFMI